MTERPTKIALKILLLGVSWKVSTEYYSNGKFWKYLYFFQNNCDKYKCDGANVHLRNLFNRKKSDPFIEILCSITEIERHYLEFFNGIKFIIFSLSTLFICWCSNLVFGWPIGRYCWYFFIVMNWIWRRLCLKCICLLWV